MVTADEVVQVEIANAEKRERRAGAGFLLHTNHFLHPELIPGSLELNATSTSRARHAHLEQRLEDYAKQVGTSGGPESTADLTDLLTTGPGEAPVSCTRIQVPPMGIARRLWSPCRSTRSASS